VKILGVIPARGGSKRLPRKNILSLNGKPLIEWTIEFALNQPEISHLLVSTDDEEISRISSKAGANVPWLRPKELSSDNAKTVDVCLHALDWYLKHHGSVDAILLLQPTSPFRSRETFLESLMNFEASSSDSLITVRKHVAPLEQLLLGSPNVSTCSPLLKSIETFGLGGFKAFTPTGNLYLSRTSILQTYNNLLGTSVFPFTSKSIYEEVDIDTSEDFKLAQLIARLR
jgi:CMP-N-acetylneuraminic acid synthetase